MGDFTGTIRNFGFKNAGSKSALIKKRTVVIGSFGTQGLYNYYAALHIHSNAIAEFIKLSILIILLIVYITNVPTLVALRKNELRL